MADELYVRVAPYDKKTGALAKRVVIGGKLFQSGNWYVIPQAQVEALLALRQSSGAPYFQACTQRQFEETARRELAAAMAAAGVSGMAMQGLTLPQPKAAPKNGPRKSAFEGLANSVGDVDMARAEPRKAVAAAAQAAVAEQADAAVAAVVAKTASEPEADDEDELGLDSLTQPELVQLAEDMGVDVPGDASAPVLRRLLKGARD
jgi:hypothetical protein